WTLPPPFLRAHSPLRPVGPGTVPETPMVRRAFPSAPGRLVTVTSSNRPKSPKPEVEPMKESLGGADIGPWAWKINNRSPTARPESSEFGATLMDVDPAALSLSINAYW